MTYDELCEERAKIQIAGESKGKEIADKVWISLGVANRHLQRVSDGTLKLFQVEREIQKCFRDVRKEFLL